MNTNAITPDYDLRALVAEMAEEMSKPETRADIVYSLWAIFALIILFFITEITLLTNTDSIFIEEGVRVILAEMAEEVGMVKPETEKYIKHLVFIILCFQYTMIKALVLVLALACVTAAVSFGKKNLETPTGTIPVETPTGTTPVDNATGTTPVDNPTDELQRLLHENRDLAHQQELLQNENAQLHAAAIEW
jgi:hypothetical protein